MTQRPSGLPAPLAGLDRTLVFGVLNITPDSFSDGGRFLDVDDAIRHATKMHADGADIVDVGGESTRPGAERVPLAEEMRRVLPVIEALTAAGVPVSIDTMRAETAQAAVAAGACIVNDVSGGLADPEMYAAVAEASVPYIVMHWRGHSVNMNDLAVYDDVLADVSTEMLQRVDEALAAGVSRDAIVLDPGLGFAKESAHNWQLLQGLPALIDLGFPLLVGASRKRFLGALLRDDDDRPRAMEDRDAATDAVTAMAALQGVWAVRVHDVASSADAVRVAQAWRAGRDPRE